MAGNPRNAHELLNSVVDHLETEVRRIFNWENVSSTIAQSETNENTANAALGVASLPNARQQTLERVVQPPRASGLAPGQNGIDGAILQRLYQNKPVYIRPSRQLIQPQDNTSQQVH